MLELLNCPCTGATLDRLVQPAILVLLAEGPHLLSNGLVVIVAADSKLELKRPHDLLSNEVKYLALGDPDAVPASKSAKQARSNLPRCPRRTGGFCRHRHWADRLG